MAAKPVMPRELARQDFDEAIGHYLAENAVHAAMGFIGALQKAYTHIARHSATCSLRAQSHR